ncbi:MAG: phosphoadenosine phosphosulfate reductase family protein [Oscillospiraceae bacterium]|nr:phosphoadenosine phosphosulfate reductase family protein [Oscillospiraceae bacterium]
MYGYEWTDEYGIFRLTIDAKIQKEIRPVFHEELDFFGMDKYWDYPHDTDAPLLWAEGVRRYVLNGVPVADALGGNFYAKPTVKLLTDERLQLKPIDTDRLYEINKNLLISLEHKAIAFIREQYKIYSEKGFSFICAFSGGKDSLVLLDLVAKALAPSDFYVMFSNTGMELSDTLKSVERAKQHWSQLRFEEAKSHMDPAESWQEFGPPASRIRWCCVVHKSVPTILKLRELTGDYNAKAVVYDGVRAEESPRRAKYDEVSIGAKNISQVNVSPIHKWNNAELYCHIFKNHILFNDAYRKGLFRVGCMVCPMSSDWYDGITGICYQHDVKELRSFVEEYAKNVKSEKAQKKYIEDGGWKTRVGGRFLPHGGNRVKEKIDVKSISFTIEEPLQSWLEVSKILGVVTEFNGKEGIQKIGDFNYSFVIESHESGFTVSYSPFKSMDRFVISHLRGVANKVAYCKGCKACEVQCPTGAFTIQPNRKILIRESLCVHCSNCIKFTDKGCLIAKSLSVTSGGTGMDLKGMNCYQNFGFQQSFLEHFMQYGVDCFSRMELGTLQYTALKKWLEHSCMIEISPTDKSISVTELGKKLCAFGPYNPLTWAIIWANLAYNSVICRWYCLNIDIGDTYEIGDLVTMLGDTYSPTTRKNAVSSLLSTFRNSPIGASIKQGLPIEQTKNTFAYCREGWDYPDAVALLYALYLYSEHTGLKTFTFTELVNAHANPDAKGISPHDIYGIDVKAFRDKIQGLANMYQDYIRVSFVANIDNIILGDYTSNDILNLAEEE